MSGISKAEQTKKFIIEKTAPIFNQKGYAGTSLSDMIEATGLTKGSIYGNFANKDEVALAAFEYNLNTIVSSINSEISKNGSIREKLLVYIKIYQKYLKGTLPIGGCPILNTSIDADDTHPQLRAQAVKAVLSWKKSIVKLVEQGIASKEFNPGVHAEQVALTMIAMIEGAIMISRLTQRVSDWDLIMGTLTNYIDGLT